MIVQTRNILADSATKTYLSYSEVAGTNVLRWKNPNGFAASWAIQVGETGEEQTEVVVLNSSTPAGTAGTLSGTTLYPHPENTPLYAIKYDQVVFERSTTGTSGTATPISNGTIGIQSDAMLTKFDDVSGSASYAYRTFFRSSGLSVNSTESDWITSAGFSFYSLAAMRDRLRGRLWNADYLTDQFLNDGINEWKDQMSNAVISVNEDYALGTVEIPFGTAGLGTITTSDYKQTKRVWITFNGTDYFKSTPIASNSFTPTQQFISTTPNHYYQGDTILGIKPDGQAGTARIEFYRFGTTMVNDTDELPLPFRSYTKSFMDYLENLALKKDGKYSEARDPKQDADNEKFLFKAEMTPRDKSAQTHVEIVEPLSGEDGLYYG